MVGFTEVAATGAGPAGGIGYPGVNTAGWYPGGIAVGTAGWKPD